MPIYRSAPVSEREEIRLERWSIREIATGGQYFVGFDVVMQDGRVSTPINVFDPQTRMGVTSSGRRYFLLGRAGRDKDAEYVWSRVIRALNITDWKDITSELCPDWRVPVPEAERGPVTPQPPTGGGAADDEADHAAS